MEPHPHCYRPDHRASLRLQNAITHASFSTESDVQGNFAFGEALNGTYVLHVEAGFAANDILLKVSQTVTRGEMTLKREKSGCGGTVIFPDWN